MKARQVTYDKIMVVNFCICYWHCAHKENQEAKEHEKGTKGIAVIPVSLHFHSSRVAIFGGM